MAKLPNSKNDVSVSTVELEGKKVKIRQFSGKEEKIILTARMKKDKNSLINAVLDIVSGCSDIDARDLPMGAVEYLFTEIRTVSVSETIDFSIACAHCKESHPVKIRASQLKVPEKFSEELELDSDYDGTPVKIVLKTPTSRMIMGDHSGDSAEISLIRDCVEEIYLGDELIDEPFTLEEFESFFMSLKNVYTRALAFVIDYPKISYENKFKCIKCGEKNEVVVKDVKDFFHS